MALHYGISLTLSRFSLPYFLRYRKAAEGQGDSIMVGHAKMLPTRADFVHGAFSAHGANSRWLCDKIWSFPCRISTFPSYLISVGDVMSRKFRVSSQVASLSHRLPWKRTQLAARIHRTQGGSIYTQKLLLSRGHTTSSR